MKYRLAPLLFAIVAIFILCNRSRWRENAIITWDASAYYMYVPSVFIYHDIDNLHSSDSARYAYAHDLQVYGIVDQHNGRRVGKYPLGVAVMEAPFFCIAHYLACPALADGYSAPYQIAFSLATICWASLGLLFIGMLLRRYHSDAVVSVTLLVIAFGTNIYHYTAFIPGWSHPFSFFLFSCLLYQSDSWLRGSKYGLPLVGLLLGMLVITRPINIIGLLIPLLWPAEEARGNTSISRTPITGILIAMLLFALPCFLQSAYWHYTSGHWIFYSYADEGFNFLRPRIGPGLFSYRIGWFVYTPIAFIMVCSIPLLFRRHKRLGILCSLVLALYVYVVFSWRPWHYAGGFSSRPMVDMLPLLSIPLAMLVSAVMQKRAFVKGILYTVFALLITLNLFQTYQYSLGVIHFFRMSKAYYWRVFGKLTITEDDKKLLLNGQEVIDQE